MLAHFILLGTKRLDTGGNIPLEANSLYTGNQALITQATNTLKGLKNKITTKLASSVWDVVL